jgi:cell division protein FtsQ
MSRAEGDLDVRAEEVVVLPDDPSDPKRERLPAWARWALAVAVAAAIPGGAYLFSRSAFFAIDDVRVVGNAHLASARVIREAGIAPEANVLSVDLEGVEARLERDPWVASATVERSLPGTITIRVDERVAVVAVERAGAFDLIASDGTVLGSGARASRLPVVRFSAALPQPSPAGAAATVAALSPDARAVVTSVEVDAMGAVTLELRSGTTVRIGTPTQLRSKGEALTAMLAFATENEIRFVSVDLRFPGAPSAQLSDGSPYEP